MFRILVLSLLAATASAQQLDNKSFKTAKSQLAKAVKRDDLEAAREAIEALIPDQSFRAVELFLDAGAKTGLPRLQTICIQAVRASESEEAARGMHQLLKKGKGAWEERVLLCEAMGAMDSSETLAALETGLDDDEPTVQRAALLALGERHEEEALLAIYGLMQREEQRRGTLFQLAQRIVERREIDDAPAFEPTVLRQPEFFGSAIASQRVVFLIDISESMREVDKPSDTPVETDDPQRALLAEFGIPDSPPTRMRIDRAKHELKRVIALLEGEVRFTVIAYHGALQRQLSGVHVKAPAEQWLFAWQHKLTEANRRSKQSAIAWLGELTANGATYTNSALGFGFEVEDADTFYLLSDGMPTEPDARGKMLEREAILENIQSWNRLRKVVIHTFGFNGRGIPGVSRGVEEGFEEFMQEIAAQNSGSYTAID